MTETRSLAGAATWLISDGKAGHEAQALGIAEALGVVAEIKRVAPTGAWRALAPWAPVAPAERFGAPGTAFAPPFPALAMAIGRTTIPYLRALRRRSGPATFAVVLLDPKASLRFADLVWVPEHDRLRGPNVISTVVGPHRYSPARLAELRRTPMPAALQRLAAPRVAVLLGGPNGDYIFGARDVARLIAALTGLADQGASLMITASRRTPGPLVDAARALAERPGVWLWDGAGDNVYPALLAHADRFVVTADSVNMCGEPAVTGKPIYVFHPGGGSAKFDRFHASLATHGAARPLPEGGQRLETWSYPPLFAADTIAEAIVRRMEER